MKYLLILILMITGQAQARVNTQEDLNREAEKISSFTLVCDNGMEVFSNWYERTATSTNYITWQGGHLGVVMKDKRKHGYICFHSEKGEDRYLLRCNEYGTPIGQPAFEIDFGIYNFGAQSHLQNYKLRKLNDQSKVFTGSSEEATCKPAREFRQIRGMDDN